ncbi:hypothetical protein BHM03_00051413 [Ensete ventricosum]|nr:hypothetical protein BHM03_00051413 [Ensete ventricosum]
MADFPPDLEDGELWLPSDIIRDVGVRRPFSSFSSPSSAAVAASPGCSAHLAYLEGIARQLDALCMLDRAGLLPAFGPPRHAPPRPRVSLLFPSLPFPSLPGSSHLRSRFTSSGDRCSASSRVGQRPGWHGRKTSSDSAWFTPVS